VWTLGIVVAKRCHDAAILDQEGKAVFRNVKFTHSRQDLDALLDLVFPEHREHFSDLFGTVSRQLLAEFPIVEDLPEVDIRRLTRLLKEASRGHMRRAHAKRLKEAAKGLVAVAQLF